MILKNQWSVVLLCILNLARKTHKNAISYNISISLHGFIFLKLDVLESRMKFPTPKIFAWVLVFSVFEFLSKKPVFKYSGHCGLQWSGHTWYVDWFSVKRWEEGEKCVGKKGSNFLALLLSMKTQGAEFLPSTVIYVPYAPHLP